MSTTLVAAATSVVTTAASPPSKVMASPGRNSTTLHHHNNNKSRSADTAAAAAVATESPNVSQLHKAPPSLSGRARMAMELGDSSSSEKTTTRRTVEKLKSPVYAWKPADSRKDDDNDSNKYNNHYRPRPHELSQDKERQQHQQPLQRDEPQFVPAPLWWFEESTTDAAIVHEKGKKSCAKEQEFRAPKTVDTRAELLVSVPPSSHATTVTAFTPDRPGAGNARIVIEQADDDSAHNGTEEGNGTYLSPPRASNPVSLDAPENWKSTSTSTQQPVLQDNYFYPSGSNNYRQVFAHDPSTAKQQKQPHGAVNSSCAPSVPPLGSSFTPATHATIQQQSSSTLSTTRITGTETGLFLPLHNVGSVFPSPSWTELSCQILPAAAKEVLSTSASRAYHTALLTYSQGLRWHRQYSDIGNGQAGYFKPSNDDDREALVSLPTVSSLPWVDRQLVQEWRTYTPLVHHNNTATATQQGQNEEEKKVSESLYAATTGLEHCRTTHEQSLDQDELVSTREEMANVAASSSQSTDSTSSEEEEDDDQDEDFDLARTLVPTAQARPVWRKSDHCHSCHKLFGPVLLRHHCRLCGFSFCQEHSNARHALPALGYDPAVPERVCRTCKLLLTEQALAERISWRLCRCRDYLQKDQVHFVPYFETGIDTAEQIVMRITQAALTMAKAIPLGAQATVAVETLQVLRRYGLTGIYTVLLRQEFLAAADLLLQALGINQTAWPLSVHELTAALFYALAQHRAMRGMNPDREHLIHATCKTTPTATTTMQNGSTDTGNAEQQQQQQQRRHHERSNSATIVGEEEYNHDPTAANKILMENIGEAPMTREPSGKQQHHEQSPSFEPVCEELSNQELASLTFYGPMALNFIYSSKEVDMQLAAAQQGWRLLYAHLEIHEQYATVGTGTRAVMWRQHHHHKHDGVMDHRPASALFVHEEQKIACLAIRGTTTIHDVVTDIRQVPVPFPEQPDSDRNRSRDEQEWTTVSRGQGVAVCGMAGAAMNLYREHIDSILQLAKNGYRIRLTGHSLGGAVATLLGVLVRRDLLNMQQRESADFATNAEREEEPVRVYGYGTPSCVDGQLSDFVASFVTTAVLHDDVVPRLTPASCRGLLKHLLHIRETWVKAHLHDDLRAITERAKTAWAPRWREGFTLQSSSSSIQRYCRKQIRKGKLKLRSVKEKLVGDNLHNEHGRHDHDFRCPDYNIQYRSDRVSFHPDVTSPETNQLQAGRCKDEADEHCESKAHITVEPKLLLDYMGGIDIRSSGFVIDGEEFFDPNADLVESDSDSDSSSEQPLDDGSAPTPRHGETEDANGVEHVAAAVFQPLALDTNPIIEPLHSDSRAQCEEGIGSDDKLEEESPGVVLLEETPLPKMFIPGKVVHIYSHRGVYKAACVPRAFRELRHITMAGNMLSDHKCKSYYEALLEVRSVRNAEESPPRWTAFDEDDTCSCCASRFTWASTSDSKAQEARDKHNCRSCGTLVCDPCSTNRIPVPSIGLTVPSRVCDRCFNDIDGTLTSPRTMTSSFLSNGNGQLPTGKDSQRTADPQQLHEKPERQRERRSALVDELASQVLRSTSNQPLAV